MNKSPHTGVCGDSSSSLYTLTTAITSSVTSICNDLCPLIDPTMNMCPHTGVCGGISSSLHSLTTDTTNRVAGSEDIYVFYLAPLSTCFPHTHRCLLEYIWKYFIATVYKDIFILCSLTPSTKHSFILVCHSSQFYFSLVHPLLLLVVLQALLPTLLPITLLRGCSQIMSAKNWGVQTPPPPPFVSQCHHFPNTHSPLCQPCQHLPNPPSFCRVSLSEYSKQKSY